MREEPMYLFPGFEAKVGWLRRTHCFSDFDGTPHHAINWLRLVIKAPPIINIAANKGEECVAIGLATLR